jgi:hypothetical protein
MERYAGREFEDYVRELAAVPVGADGRLGQPWGKRQPGPGRGRLGERPRPRPGDTRRPGARNRAELGASARLRQPYPNLTLVHTPTHASWLNQIEVFFSILQRKVLTPAVADGLAELDAPGAGALHPPSRRMTPTRFTAVDHSVSRYTSREAVDSRTCLNEWCLGAK